MGNGSLCQGVYFFFHIITSLNKWVKLLIPDLFPGVIDHGFYIERTVIRVGYVRMKNYFYYFYSIQIEYTMICLLWQVYF